MPRRPSEFLGCLPMIAAPALATAWTRPARFHSVPPLLPRQALRTASARHPVDGLLRASVTGTSTSWRLRSGHPQPVQTPPPAALEVEEAAPEPAPEPEQPVAPSQPELEPQTAAVSADSSKAARQQPGAPDSSRAAVTTAVDATPRLAAPPQSPAAPTPEKTAATKPRRSVSSVSAGAVGMGHTTSNRGMGTRRKRQLHVPESLLPHLNQLHKMFPKVSVTVRSEAFLPFNSCTT